MRPALSAPVAVIAVIFALATVARGESPVILRRGPHPLIDDHLIAASKNVRRVVNRPSRRTGHANPVITGAEDGCFQPYATVLRDAPTGRFRIWYGARTEDRNATQSRLATMESDDGIAWKRPHRLLDTPFIQFGASVLHHDGRYTFAWWAPAEPAGQPAGMKLATSPDGIDDWTQLSRPGAPSDVILPHDHDINSIYHDPVRNRFLAIASTYVQDPAWTGRRRVTMQSHSDDLLHWSPPRRILVPDPKAEHDQTQFYAMDGFLARGDLLIGMVKVLRDDLRADDPPDPPDAYGIGYTALAWTRDGQTWTRDHEPFLDRDPRRGTWDHAHAWIDEQVPVGDEVFLYYGGYARGHKVNRFEERQIGVLRMKRDRYVARAAGADGGSFSTPLLNVEGDEIVLNADAKGGELRVQVLDGAGKPIPGFTLDDCEPLRADTLAGAVRWNGRSGLPRGPVRLEFAMRSARIYAIEVR